MCNPAMCENVDLTVNKKMCLVLQGILSLFLSAAWEIEEDCEKQGKKARQTNVSQRSKSQATMMPC